MPMRQWKEVQEVLRIAEVSTLRVFMDDDGQAFRALADGLNAANGEE